MVGGQKVEVARATDKGFPFEGTLDFVDQGVDTETGTLRLRAVFPNPDPVNLIR